MARKVSIREREKELEKLRNRPRALLNLPTSNAAVGCKSPCILKRGKPNTFQVRPSPIKVAAGKKPTGSPSYRIKMSFKEGQLQQPKVVPRVKNDTKGNPTTSEIPNNKDLQVSESLTNLRQDISSLIEKSFGSNNEQGTPSSVSSGTTFSSSGNSIDPDEEPSIVGKGINMLTINNEKEKNASTVNDITTQMHDVNMHRPGFVKKPSIKMKWLGMGEETTMNLRSGSQPHMRRQSSAFEFCRLPSAIVAMEKAKRVASNTNSIRRQSSAFEIRRDVGRLGGFGKNMTDQTEEHIYENFNRAKQPAMRASLRHKNSSVKDLVQKLENTGSSTALDVPVPLLESAIGKDKRKSLSTSALPIQNSTLSDEASVKRKSTAKLVPLHMSRTKLQNHSSEESIPEDNFKMLPEVGEIADDFDEFGFGESAGGTEEWMDAAEFFNKTPVPTRNFRMSSNINDDLTISSASGCKRSSIIRIRTEKKGLVSKSVATFTKPIVPSSSAAGKAMEDQHALHQQRHTMLPPTGIPRTPTTKPPPIIRHSTANTPRPASRRLSARMGVAGRGTIVSGNKSIISNARIVPTTPPMSMGVAGVAARRRQTNSIRTDTTNGRKTELREASKDIGISEHSKTTEIPGIKVIARSTGINNTENVYENVATQAKEKHLNTSSGKKDIINGHLVIKNSKPENIVLKTPPVNINRTPASRRNQTNSGSRKSKRIEERRYLTIGYTGERVRSPLKEKQNLIATVQRSKSAQTPANLTKLQPRNMSSSSKRRTRRNFRNSPYTENPLYPENILGRGNLSYLSSNVQRSKSLRSPQPLIGKNCNNNS